MSLRIVPVSLDEANAFVAAHHRHHKVSEGLGRGGNWHRESRPRVDTAEALRGQKLLWEAA